jgi:hypothetical protein
VTHSARRTRWLAASVLGVLLVAALGAPRALAQGEPGGRITGTVTLATADAELEAGTQVELIVLDGGNITGTATGTVVDGRYEIPVEADPRLTYVPRLEYGGVQYFANPVILSPEAPTATGDFTVYASTSEVPDLQVNLTAVTVVALDRGASQIGLLREDLVQNPTDRAFVGDSRGITLRLPAPEGTLDADGENVDGLFALEGGVLTTTTPLRAASETSVVTRYLIEYDPAEDAYTLRITAPLPTTQILLRVPEDYVRDLRLPDGASEGERDEITLSDGEVVPLRTVVMDNVKVGDSLVVVLDGFAPTVNKNLLTAHTRRIPGLAR